MIDDCLALYVSLNSKPDHPVITAPGVGFSPNFLFSEGLDFESEKFPTVLKEKCSNLMDFSKKPGDSLKSRCSCAVSYQFFSKTEDVYCIFNNRPFSAISVILIKFSGHPMVISANGRSSLKF